MIDGYSGNWRDNRPSRHILRDWNRSKLEKRVEGLAKRGYKIVSNPEIAENPNYNGKIEYITVMERIKPLD